MEGMERRKERGDAQANEGETNKKAERGKKGCKDGGRERVQGRIKGRGE